MLAKVMTRLLSSLGTGNRCFRMLCTCKVAERTILQCPQIRHCNAKACCDEHLARLVQNKVTEGLLQHELKETKA